MRKIACIILGGILCLASSCNIDEHLPVNDVQEGNVTIVANMPQRGGETKVAFNDDESARVLYVDWKDSGEKFSVIKGGVNSTFTQTASAEDEKNIFEGTCPNQEGTGLYYAIYPHNEFVTDVTAVPFDLSEQNGTLDETKTYMYACSDNITDGSELDFRQMTAILKPNFNLQSGEKVMTVIITLPEGAYTKGTYNVSDLAITPDSDNKCSINVFANNTEQVYVYLPAIEVTEPKEMALEVHTTNSMYTATIQLTKSIKSGTLYETELNLTETSEYVWTSGTSATVPAGEGTEGSPYEIVTAGHLQWLLGSVNNDNPTLNKYYKLTHNLVISSSESNPWIPIGRGKKKETSKFVGVLDGNGHIISGVLVSQYANSTVQEEYSFGLFGYLDNNDAIRSIAKNITLNLDVTGGNTLTNLQYAAENTNTGILAGLNYGIIENCIIYGNVRGGTAQLDADISGTGGVVGMNLWKVKNCINRSNVTGGYANNGSRTGGIAGRSGSQFDPESEIISCANYGNITGGGHGSFGSGGYGSNITGTGGIIGNLDGGTVKNSINYGVITASKGNIGGVIGNYSRGTVYSCNKDNSPLNTIIGKRETSSSTADIVECTGDHS